MSAGSLIIVTPLFVGVSSTFKSGVRVVCCFARTTVNRDPLARNALAPRQGSRRGQPQVSYTPLAIISRENTSRTKTSFGGHLDGPNETTKRLSLDVSGAMDAFRDTPASVGVLLKGVQWSGVEYPNARAALRCRVLVMPLPLGGKDCVPRVLADA